LIDDCTSISETSAHNIKVYPNPVSDLLNIKLEMENVATCTFTITNYSGKILDAFIHKTNTDDQLNLSINVEHLTPGIYILQINPEKENPMQARFIKE
jgi:hypothetical protein